MDPDRWLSLSDPQREAILDSPALEPPPGVESNFKNPSNRNDLVIGMTTFCVFLATTFVLIRAYSRLYVLKRIQVEDGK
jgi:hypothetical protein